MKKLLPILTATLICNSVFSQPQKLVSNCTINYAVSSSDTKKAGEFAKASKTIYIKGKDIRVDINSASFNQTFFYNSNTGEVTILKEVGQSKYISHYNSGEWERENEMYNGIQLSQTGVTKNILNYECREAILQLKNGSSYTIYYAPVIVPSVTENIFEFKNVPGLVLEYETSLPSAEKVKYTATKINFDPVPAFQFEIPKNGYRVLH